MVLPLGGPEGLNIHLQWEQPHPLNCALSIQINSRRTTAPPTARDNNSQVNRPMHFKLTYVIDGMRLGDEVLNFS